MAAAQRPGPGLRKRSSVKVKDRRAPRGPRAAKKPTAASYKWWWWESGMVMYGTSMYMDV